MTPTKLMIMKLRTAILTPVYGILLALGFTLPELRAEQPPQVVKRMKEMAAELAQELGDGQSAGSGVRRAGFVD